MSAGADWSASFESASLSRLRVYDEVMVPRIFEPWAKLLLDQVEINQGEAVLDIACGPGTVARMASERLGSGGRVTACDISPAMLELARAKPPVRRGAEIVYLEASADHLPVPDAECDVVTCQQGLQFFPNRDAAVAEMRRAVRPDGRVGAAVWTEMQRSPALSALADAVERVAGRELADRYRDGPWGFPDGRLLAELFERGGFSDIRVSTHVLPTPFEEGTPQIVATLAASGIAEQIDQLSPDQRQQILETLTGTLGSGPVNSEMESNVVTARRG
ncbi:MAG TPA: class I SAM-dependent methyltransferase [Solirubrobacteraceae bacterium]